ncbi:MAG TPA: hypothetical protein VGM29_04495 [Polyangiaceae bacterium]|jgi:hypothetical protein
MTEQHLSALLTAAQATKDDKGWAAASEGRLLTLYVAYNGAGFTVSRIEAVKVDGQQVHARTNKGELYVLALSDVYAGAIEAASGSGAARKAGFA